jgi:hypothetical protein
MMMYIVVYSSLYLYKLYICIIGVQMLYDSVQLVTIPVVVSM